MCVPTYKDTRNFYTVAPAPGLVISADSRLNAAVLSRALALMV